MEVREGAWIIDTFYGEMGTVSKAFEDGVTATFGKRVSIRTFQQIKLAPLDIQQEDLKDMMELALMTKDIEWAKSISQQMKEGVKG